LLGNILNIELYSTWCNVDGFFYIASLHRPRLDLQSPLQRSGFPPVSHAGDTYAHGELAIVVIQPLLQIYTNGLA